MDRAQSSFRMQPDPWTEDSGDVIGTREGDGGTHWKEPLDGDAGGEFEIETPLILEEDFL